MNFDILRSENIMPDEAIEFLKLCSRAGLGVASVGYHGSRADEIRSEEHTSELQSH